MARIETALAVRGLDALIKGTKGIAPDLGKDVGRVNRAFARRLVPLVKSAYGRNYPRHQLAFFPTVLGAFAPAQPRIATGNSVRSIRAGGGQGYGRITIGGARAPHMPGQEFGSDRYPQFRPWTGPAPGGGRGSRGRFLYPTIRSEYPDLKAEHMEALVAALKKNFPDEMPAGGTS